MGRELIPPSLLCVAISIGGGLSACGAARRPIESPAPAAASAERSPEAPLAERVRARVMRVAITEERTRDQARERATALARTARADDFSEIASQYGDGDEPRRTELGAGGLEITAEGPAIVPPSVREAARALAVREVSRPIESEDGFWILQRIQ